MVGIANKPGLTDKLNETFATLYLDRTQQPPPPFGTYARVAFAQFTSEAVLRAFGSIPNNEEVYWKRDDRGYDSITLHKNDGRRSCKTNQTQDNDSLQEVFHTLQIEGDYSLHILLVEKNKKKGEADIGLFLTDKEGTLLLGKTFDYETEIRLNYSSIVSAMAERLASKLERIPLDATSSQQKLQRLTNLQRAFDIENLVTAIHLYGPPNIQKEKYEFHL